MLFDKSLFQQVLTAYKAVFVSKQWPEEKYKWVAVKHFQDNWDIDAPDFAAMLKDALAQTGNLLISAGRFPGKMIEEFAEVAPEQVRAMFKELFDETLDIWQRVKSFKEKSQPLLGIHGKNAKNHYQGENTIFTYLWLRYPEKYYIYKISELKTVAETLHSNLVFQNGKYEDNIRNFLEFYDAIRQELLADDELKTLLKTLYESENIIASTARKIMAQKAMIGWTSGGHSNGYVPVFAIGNGAKEFTGRIDNTDIPKRIMKAARYK